MPILIGAIVVVLILVGVLAWSRRDSKTPRCRFCGARFRLVGQREWATTCSRCGKDQSATTSA